MGLLRVMWKDLMWLNSHRPAVKIAGLMAAILLIPDFGLGHYPKARSFDFRVNLKTFGSSATFRAKPLHSRFASRFRQTDNMLTFHKLGSPTCGSRFEL